MYPPSPPERRVITSRGGPRSQQETGVKGRTQSKSDLRRPGRTTEQQLSTRGGASGGEKEHTPMISVGRLGPNTSEQGTPLQQLKNAHGGVDPTDESFMVRDC